MPETRLDHAAAHRKAEEPPEHIESPGLRPEEIAYEPVRVKVETNKPEKFIGTTIVLNAANPFVRILPRDPNRTKAEILANTNAIVLCESVQKAQSPNNIGAPPAQPQGAYVPAGVRWPVGATSEVWAAATTIASSTLVSVTVEQL